MLKIQKRYSSFFPNPLSNQLGIVHRQGQDYGFIPLFLIELYFIIAFVIQARRQVFGISLIDFAILVLFGFTLYLFLTIIIRRFFYNLITHYQGLQHPKLMIALGILIIDWFILIHPFLSLGLYIFAILVGVDVILQNQMHDIVSTIGPNSWEITTLIPVFQVPFDKDISINMDEQNRYVVGLSIRKKNAFFLTNSRFLSELEINQLLEGEEIESDIISFSMHLLIADELNRQVSDKEKIEVYRTKNQAELQELMYEINNLVKIRYFDE